MRGDLSETPAADACRQLAGDGSTGVLTVAGPEGPGTVTFVTGRIVGATSPSPRARLGDRLVGAGFLEDAALTEALDTQRASSGRSRLGALLVERTLVPRDAIRLFVQEQALDALFEVVAWRYGSFAFLPGPADDVPEVPVAMAVADALVEVSRREQLWRELSASIPDLECIPTFRPDPTSAVTSLEPDEFAVLASIDGERSVRALATDLGYGEFELARIVYGLVLLGIVDIQLPEDEIGAALDDAMAYTGHTEAAAAGPGVTEGSNQAEAPHQAEAAAPSLPAGHDLGFFAGPRPPADAPPEEPASAAEPPAPPEKPPATPEESPAPPEEPPAAVEPPAVSDEEPMGQVVPSALPESSFSDVLRELRGLDEDATANRARPTTAARDLGPQPREPGREDPTTSDAAVSAAAAPPSAPPPTAAPRPARSEEDGDVSEFLRELSRLALDEERDDGERPRRTPPLGNDPKDDDGKRKRRGIFGRG